MTTNFHTPITTGADANAAIINAPLSELDTKMSVSLDTDGSLKAGSVDNAAVLASGVVTEAKIGSSAVTEAKIGSGAVTEAKIGSSAVTEAKIGSSAVTEAKIGSGAVTVNKIGTGSVTNDKLETDVKIGSLTTLNTAEKGSVVGAINEVVADVTAGALNLVFDPTNQFVGLAVEIDSRLRWSNTTQVTTVDPDTDNPFGGRTLRFANGAAVAFGKFIYFDETGLKPGDVLSCSIYGKAASGTFAAGLYWYDSDGVYTGDSDIGSPVTYSGSTVETKKENVTIPASADKGSVVVAVVRESGTASFDLYSLQANVGATVTDARASQVPALQEVVMARDGYDTLLDKLDTIPQPMILRDPYATDEEIGEQFNELQHWWNDDDLTIIDPDASNPYGGRTMRFAPNVGNTSGKRVYLREEGLGVGDLVSVGIRGKAAGSYWRIGIYWWDASGSFLGLTNLGTTTLFAGAEQELSVEGVSVPPAAVGGHIIVAIGRVSGTDYFDVYALWANKGPVLIQPGSSQASHGQKIRALQHRQSSLQYLRNWRAALAKLRTGTTSLAKIAIIGDSFIEMEPTGGGIARRLRELLQDDYGNAGIGWISFEQTRDLQVTFARTGTWTDVQNTSGSLGPDISHVLSTDASTPAKMTTAVAAQTFVIHYRTHVGGGKFRHRVDAGAWTIVDTDGTTAYSTVTISSLSDASHALEIEVYEAGSQGVILYGVEARKTDTGVRVDKLGSSGSTSANWASVNAANWEAGLQALAPDLMIILLGTNDPSLFPDSTTTGNRQTIIDRILTAMPLADILIVSPWDTQGGGGISVTGARDRQLLELATVNRLPFISGWSLFGAYADSNSRSLALDATHPNGDGDQIFADAMYMALRM